MKDLDVINMRMATVRKANDLIQKSRFSLSLQQQKIVLYLISQISPFDKDLKLYEFSIRDFCSICGIGLSGKNYSDLKKTIKEIADKSLWITLSETGTETLLRWIEKPYIDEHSGTIKIRLDADMKPFLIQLRKNYTQYELFWTLNFRCKYTIRLYEEIKSVHYHDLDEYDRDFPLDELKGIMDAESYKTFQTFKTRVLNPAVNEINEFSDKNIEYQVIKSGRSISGIRMKISSKESLETMKLQSNIAKDLGLEQLDLFSVERDGVKQTIRKRA